MSIVHPVTTSRVAQAVAFIGLAVGLGAAQYATAGELSKEDQQFLDALKLVDVWTGTWTYKDDNSPQRIHTFKVDSWGKLFSKKAIVANYTVVELHPKNGLQTIDEMRCFAGVESTAHAVFYIENNSYGSHWDPDKEGLPWGTIHRVEDKCFFNQHPVACPR